MRTRPIFVLGIHTGHNATAALLRDGAVIGCVSEERFTRRKNQSGIPRLSIARLLRDSGIRGADLAGVAVATRWRSGLFDAYAVRRPLVRTLKVVYDAINPVRWMIARAIPPARAVDRLVEQAVLRAVGSARTRRERAVLSELIGVPFGLISVQDHHACHAAAAYYGSPFSNEDALVFTVDAEGDGVAATVQSVRNGRWQRLAVTPSDASLGWMYYELTGYLGMQRNEHEYKVMGLAPYARADRVQQLYQRIANLITLDPRDPLRFRSRFDTHFMRRYLQKEMREQRFDRVAGAFQKLVEERLCEWVREGVRRTGIRTVCLGGGVAMNVKANLRIAELSEVERFFPCPSASDESTAIGAAYLLYNDLRQESDPLPEPLNNLYLGPAFTDRDVADAIDEFRASPQFDIVVPPDINETIADLLAGSAIVARCTGRMEWGARALGNRSILADPSNPHIVRVLNEQVKSRDFWMPFAPSILAECAGDYLVNPKHLPAPYMALAFRTTPLGEQHLCAAIHPYDRTVRPQVVDEQVNPEYHRLIRAFERRTGIGAVLNTSFNLHGEPIVSGAHDALDVFARSGLQYLALGRFLIHKRS
jgi:carbamoyltransferase